MAILILRNCLKKFLAESGSSLFLNTSLLGKYWQFTFLTLDFFFFFPSDRVLLGYKLLVTWELSVLNFSLLGDVRLVFAMAK